MSSPVQERSPLARSPAPVADDVLTPSRKVRALLAQFDDSDDEVEDNPDISSKNAERQLSSGLDEKGHRLEQKERFSAHSDAENDDDLLPLAPRGRLASRLQQAAVTTPKPQNAEYEGTAYDRLRRQFHGIGHFETELEDAGNQGKESERASTASPPRRRLLKRKLNDLLDTETASIRSRSGSPLFYASQSENQAASPQREHNESEHAPPTPENEASKSRFLALVEKHRKQRREREAAEAAKQAAHADELANETGRAERSSSILQEIMDASDDSERSVEELTQKSRPGRKASKKALEEMNRETQRMSRNMQLAHQARTRKKITKESLLERFNFPNAESRSNERTAVPAKSTTASSAPASDSEAPRANDTPSTSPPLDPTVEKATDESQSLSTAPKNVMPSDLFSDVRVVSASVPLVDQTAHDSAELSENKKEAVRPIRLKVSKADLVQLDQSDSDLEIITSKSNTRKFALFEALPKRKAQETGSHVALRSLGHVGLDDRKARSSMNNAGMEISLRRAAREQARREREERLQELRAKGVIVQTADQRDRDQQEVEDLVERARFEAAEIHKREKMLAKKNGTFVKDELDEDDSDEEDGDFADGDVGEEEEASDSDEGDDEADEANASDEELVGEDGDGLLDNTASEDAQDEASEQDPEDRLWISEVNDEWHVEGRTAARRPRMARVVSDDEEEVLPLPAPAKTPRSAPRSTKKAIPGITMSDDLPLGLTQAFAATMAESQSQGNSPFSQDEENLDPAPDLASLAIPFGPRLNRLDSMDMVSDSQPASQTQPLNLNLSFSQEQAVHQSPVMGLGIQGTPFLQSQVTFEPTQDAGYMLTPFTGDRFALETPSQRPQSTVDTVILSNNDESPIAERKGRLVRGRASHVDEAVDTESHGVSAFEVMRKTAKLRHADPDFDKAKSAAKGVIDEAAEESEDEYAGLGGASDDDEGEVDEEDHKMIDETTQIGTGDAEQFAGIFADRERKQDEAAVSKLLKDITTGALRRKRGVGDDLDLSDEEDAAARRREAKRREFAKMRRELLKDEAVSKIAEDRKKEAFLRSIEDREVEEDSYGFDQPETPLDEPDSQSQSNPFGDQIAVAATPTEPKSQLATSVGQKAKTPLDQVSDSALNRIPAVRCRAKAPNKRPTTLAEIRESVSFLIEEPDAQAGTIDLGLSDSEDEPEAYVDLDRHLRDAEMDEHGQDDDVDDLGDFVIDDEKSGDDSEDPLTADHTRVAATFKKPALPPTRAPFNKRRTRLDRKDVVDRLELIRQSSSLSTNSVSGSSKLAFHRTSSTESLSKVPTLLRRVTTNSSSFSFGSMSGRTNTSGSGEEMSATGVVTVTNRTERGSRAEEKEFVRKAVGGGRMAVNFDHGRAKAIRAVDDGAKAGRVGIAKSKGKGKAGGKGKSGFLGGLFRGHSWD